MTEVCSNCFNNSLKIRIPIIVLCFIFDDEIGVYPIHPFGETHPTQARQPYTVMDIRFQGF